MNSANEARITSKNVWRLLPLIMLIAVVNYLDRANIAFAALQMNKDLGFSPSVYGFGAGVFFLGYCLFEVPSNLVMTRVGARVWLSRIMITWGIIATGMAWLSSETSFYIMRFLLGVAEAGFLPAIMYYFRAWFPAQSRGKVLSIFMSQTAIANMAILRQKMPPPTGLLDCGAGRCCLSRKACHQLLLDCCCFAG